jgi:hypothetical protein
MAEKRAVGGTGQELASSWRRRPRAPEAEDAQRLLSGAAWEEFCDALRRAGRTVLASEARSDLDRAEGFRHLATLTAAGLRHVFDLADPERPRFLRNPDSTSKWGAENADNQYLLAQIRADRSYLIRGRRGSVWAFLLEIKEGYMQLGDPRNFATLHSDDLRVDSDGSFEIALGGERRPGNWVELHPDATQVLIRQYFLDWEREEPAHFEIHPLDDPGTPAPAWQPARVARLLDDAGLWVEDTLRVWQQWVHALRAAFKRDEIAAAERFVGGADDIRYGNDYYRLAPDQALLIELEPPDARYWAFQLVDNWFGSLDWANRQASLNQQQLQVDPDGRVRIAVAHRDPGCPNWLDTGGHLEAVLQYRYIWTRDAPLPRKRVVPHDELWAHLPPGTPRVTAEQRRAAIALRQRHLQRREVV